MQENYNNNNIGNTGDSNTYTAKDLVYEALRAHKEFLSYEEIPDILKRLGLIDESIDEKKLILNLRNGMSQLIGELKYSNDYVIEDKTLGKKKYFKITDKNQNETVTGEGTGEAIEIFDENPYASMEFVARRLMRDRRMPFYGIYLPLRAAGRWVVYSDEDENASEKKPKYEGDQCEELLKDWFAELKKQKKAISIIGLGVGEGIGEIEIIERLLKQGFEVHYFAIDMNEYLLMDHSTRIKYKFKEEIKRGDLVCAVVLGNFLKDFSDKISLARDKFKRKNIFQNFIPKDSGILVTFLGNVLGNLEHRASEWMYFQTILDEFKGQDVAFLLGVGVAQKESDGKAVSEEYPLDELFLTTPKYLTHELGIIENKNSREFFIEKDHKEEKHFQYVVNGYKGDGLISDSHVEGNIYEFLYTTKGELKMTIAARDNAETLIVPPETKLLLYNIIKFDLEKLIDFLKSKGLYFPSEDIKTHIIGKNINKKKQRVYAVLAAIKESYNSKS